MEKLNRREKREKDTGRSSEGENVKDKGDAERERNCQNQLSSSGVFQQADSVSVSCNEKLKSDSVDKWTIL